MAQRRGQEHPAQQELFNAVFRGGSLDQIATIVEAHPEHVFGGLLGSALQYVCYRDRPLEIIKYLHEKVYQQGISTGTVPDKLRFFVDFRCDSDNAVDVVKFLVNSSPSYVDPNDEKAFAYRVVHELCKTYPGTRLMDFMVKKYPEALTMAVYDGELPLHVRARYCAKYGVNSTPEHDLGALVDACPVALLVKNCKGKTPAQACPEGEVEHRRYLEERQTQVTAVIEDMRSELSIIAEQYYIPEAVQGQIWAFVFPDFVPCWKE